MVKYSLTYDEAFFDKHPDEWHQVKAVATGFEFCLTLEQLSLPLYLEIIADLIRDQKILAFHLPYHLDPRLALATEDYLDYYQSLTRFLYGAGYNKHFAISVIHHPLPSSLRDTFELLKDLHQAYASLGLMPMLEITSKHDAIEPLLAHAASWQEAYYYPLLCQDIFYLNQLSWLENGNYRVLMPYTGYFHYHHPYNAHREPHCNYAFERRWLKDALVSGHCINIELLDRCCEDYFKEVTQTIKLIKSIE